VTYGGPTDVATDVLGKLLHLTRVLRWAVPPLMLIGKLVGRRRVAATTLLPLGYLLVARREADDRVERA